MTREEKEQIGKYVLQMARSLEYGCYQQEMLLKAVRIIDEALEQEPRKGHWTEEFNDLEGEVRFTCSSCGKYQLFGTDFCYHCGSDNREVEE